MQPNTCAIGGIELGVAVAVVVGDEFSNCNVTRGELVVVGVCLGICGAVCLFARVVINSVPCRHAPSCRH